MFEQEGLFCMQAHKNESIVLAGEDWDLGAVQGDARTVLGHGDSLDEAKGYDDTVRWPIWRTIVLVVTVCSAFWIGVGALVMRALG